MELDILLYTAFLVIFPYSFFLIHFSPFFPNLEDSDLFFSLGLQPDYHFLIMYYCLGVSYQENGPVYFMPAYLKLIILVNKIWMCMLRLGRLKLGVGLRNYIYLWK